MNFKSKISISILAASALGIGTVPKFHVPGNVSPWRCFVADAGHSGNTLAVFNFAAYNTSTIGTVSTCYSSPVLTNGTSANSTYGYRGALVVGDDAGHINCLPISAGGTQSWTYSTGGAVKATPWIGNLVNLDDVFVGSDDNYFYRIKNSPTGTQGTLLARYLTGGAIRSSAVGDETNSLVYFGSDDYKIYGLSAASSSLALDWSYPTGGPVESSPTYDSTNCYVGSDDGYLYAIYRFTAGGHTKGNLDWRYNVGSVIRSSPTICGGVVFGANDQYVYSLDYSGNLNWRFLTGGAINSSPAHSGDNSKIYIGSDDGYLYCLNSSTGAQIWRISLGSPIKGAPAICHDGTFMVATDTDGVYNVASDGSSLLHHFSASTSITSSPAVGMTDARFGATQRAFYVTHSGTVIDIK